MRSEAFETKTKTIRISDILPVRQVATSVLKSTKYAQILSSIEHIGLVEPPVVAPTGDGDHFALLDGHWRLEALRELGWKSVECIVAKVDEHYTYNRQVNRLTPIQEHLMIKKAVEKGVPEDKISEILGLNQASVNKRLHLLDGIYPDAARVLKDKQVPITTMKIIRRAKKQRQIEMANLMCVADNFKRPYAVALLTASRPDQLRKRADLRPGGKLSDRDRAKMRRELSKLQKRVVVAEANFGKELTRHTMLGHYCNRLLGNARVVRYLAKKSPELLQEMQDFDS